MDPVSSQAARQLSAMQALLVRQGTYVESSFLTALLGQDLEVLLQAAIPGGVMLQLPSGQVLTAQGELPYPEGTQLRVRILPAPQGEGGLRLQLQEATPPAPSALLAPLTQGEAAPLAARLAQASPPVELMPLVRLLALLTEEQPASGSLPSAEQVHEALRQLPASLQSSLGQALGTGPATSPKDLSAALGSFLRESQEAKPAADLPETQAEALDTVVRQAVARFQALASGHPALPGKDLDDLVAWLRNLFQRASGGTPQTPAALPQAQVRSTGALPLPGTEQLQEALRQLPGTTLSCLGRALGSGPTASVQELATTLRTFLLESRQAAPAAVPTGARDEAVDAAVQQVVARFQAMASGQSGLPESDQNGLVAWLRNLLQKSPEGAPQASGTQVQFPARPSPAASPGVLPLPGTEQLQEALRRLPGATLASLGRALGSSPTASLQELATTLRAFLLEARQAAPTTGRPAAQDEPMDPVVQQAVVRFQAMLSGRSELTASHQADLVTWLKDLLKRTSEAEPRASRELAQPEASRAESPRRPGQTVAPDALIPPRLTAALLARPGDKAELPEAWESWIRGTISTLSDPEASPREAPFHALQAKEGTAFFEIPVPWAQAAPLQIWVESEAPESRGGGRDAAKRVLLGLRFSGLGETRLGLAQDAAGLQVRVWTEHPEALEGEKENMQKQLTELGKPVDLRIYALAGDAAGVIPTVRALAVGPSLSALG